MLSNICKDCKHVIWMVSIGQGVRCSHPDNQKFIPKKENKNLKVIISYVPIDCNYYEKK